MKRFIVICFALILTVSMMGCADKQELTDGKIARFDSESAEATNSVGSTEPEEEWEMTTSDSNTWGILLSAENITPTGLTLIVSQEGGTPTGELQFGSDYTLKVRQNDTWQNVPYIFDEGNIAWTQEAYLLPLGGSTTQEITWEYLYGELPVGRYLLGKTFQDFRGAGDFDTDVYAVEFEIK